MSDLKYWNALALFPKFGSHRFKKLYNYFSSMEKAFNASFKELQRANLDEEIIYEFLKERPKINPDKEWEKLVKENIHIITVKDKCYPELLKEIYTLPALLYVKGKLDEQNEFAVGVVGTRKMTPYGKQVTPQIVRELAANKITIVSGLALGIDTLAHTAALEVKGRTIAVLGSGLNQQNIYPFSNRRLAQQIIESGGALISEHPFGTPPLRQNFPHRNRIISGLSLATLVVEAPENSGALITAKYALEQNRDIFAIPGNIYNRTSIGPNNLIKMGAKLVTSASDILDDLNLTQVASFIENKKIVPDTKEEECLLKYLSREPIHIDQLVKLAELDIAKISSTLTMMEMKGKVRNLGGMNYVVTR